jgi:hypothetical protein
MFVEKDESYMEMYYPQEELKEKMEIEHFSLESSTEES